MKVKSPGPAAKKAKVASPEKEAAAPALSYDDAKAKTAQRVLDFSALDPSQVTDALVQEIRELKPKPKPGWINKEAWVVCTSKLNIYRGKPWPSAKNALAWTKVLDVSENSGKKDLVVHFLDYDEVGVAVHGRIVTVPFVLPMTLPLFFPQMVMPNTGTLLRKLKANQASSEFMKREHDELTGASVHHRTIAGSSRWKFEAVLPHHVRNAFLVVETGVPISLMRAPAYHR